MTLLWGLWTALLWLLSAWILYVGVESLFCGRTYPREWHEDDDDPPHR